MDSAATRRSSHKGIRVISFRLAEITSLKFLTIFGFDGYNYVAGNVDQLFVVELIIVVTPAVRYHTPK